MSNNTNTVKAITSNVRPRQVLLVGLGGVGSRTVDAIMSIMPSGYKPYTKAIVLDTDIGEIDSRIKNIPSENRIALGSNSDNGQSVTVGEYIKNNPETTDWFVKGGHLRTIEKRNTAQGAKQIRMVSRIALSATNDFCGMKKRLEDILQDMNSADGTNISQGLLVMVVCSVAGGTGAGTVLQVPLYLEQALAKNFADEDIQMECAMLLPNMFSRAQDIENQSAARANAYAVVRELMSLNSGRLKRGDILPNCDFEKKSEYISPYGRILFFDDVSMSGDSIEQDLDKVYVPKTANALNEYLFGPASGKITSALDNTLARVYRTGGASIFSSVGSAKLEFPRATYVQYVMGKWITNVISEDWRAPDTKANSQYTSLKKDAVDNDTRRPDEWDRRKLYRQSVDETNTPFFREIKHAYYVEKGKKKISLAKIFWDRNIEYLTDRALKDKTINNAKKGLTGVLEAKGNANAVEEKIRNIENAVNEIVSLGAQHEMNVMRPTEAEAGVFYDPARNRDEKYLFTFLQKNTLHPVMLRYFLLELYELVKEEAEKGGVVSVEYKNLENTKNKKERLADSKSQAEKVITSAPIRVISEFAKNMLNDLEIYIEEIEGMFKCLNLVVEAFEQSARNSINGLIPSNPKSGTILAGGQLSMMYTWKQVEAQTGGGDDIYTIDNDLNGKIHEVVYRAFYEQVAGKNAVTGVDGGNFKIRTKYEKLVREELQKYYSRLLKDRYSMCFPQNVIEAALLECGLGNTLKDHLSRMDEPEKYTIEQFIDRGSKPTNYSVESDEIPDGMVSDAKYLEALLGSTIGNAKPYCGRVDDNAGNKGIINRLMVVNRNLCRTEVDPHNVDENGIAKMKYIEDELIDGVSTSRIRETNVNTQFVSRGISQDEIKIVTTLAGLQPFNFVAFLPPDDNEHDPAKGETYYESYKEIIDDIAVNNNCITPHLHRNWHLADMLEDFTTDHTSAYNKRASEAFVYGFVFDIIKVKDGGVVEIGKLNNPYFKRIFGEEGVKTFVLLEAAVHASINDAEYLDGTTGGSKRDTMNSILVKIYELLATSQPLRDAIYGYAENEMKTFAVEKKPEFISNCLMDENISHVTYNCILDVMDGYYQGTCRIQYKEADRGIKNVGFMFTVLLEKIYEMCKIFSSEPAQIKKMYDDLVELLYQDAFCDDVATGANAGSAASVANIVGAVADDEDDDQQLKDIFKIIEDATNKSASAATKIFADGQRFGRENAHDMIDSFLNK